MTNKTYINSKHEIIAMESKPIEMNLRCGSNLKSIFEEPKHLTKKDQVEKIMKDLAKLDREILFLQNQYNSLLLEKVKLIREIEEENGR